MSQQSQAKLDLFTQHEYAHAPLPDERLQARQVQIARRLADKPAASLPAAMVTDAETEGLYRFLRNPRVTPEAILAPHRAATVARAQHARRVLAVHDGTEYEYTHLTAATGLGRLRQGKRGFFAHLTLLLSDEPAYEPLGVPVVSTWVRTATPRSKDPATGRRRTGAYFAALKDKESTYWLRHIEATEQALGPGVQVTHVMDSGADSYERMAAMSAAGFCFVLRSARDRRILDEDANEGSTLGQWLAEASVRVTREVLVRKRAAKNAPCASRRAPARVQRMARVGIAARPVTLRRPCYLHDDPPELEVNAVAVCELAPPQGVEPIAWVLFTSEPIATVADLERIVDLYVQRFGIEVYIDVLKNHCLTEQRRLQGYAALVRMLALSIPIAWQLLRVRALSRQSGRAATDVVSPRQLRLLQSHPDVTLPARPQAADVLRAIARLGGNVGKRTPGWRVLGRGFDVLLQMEVGWILAEERRKL